MKKNMFRLLFEQKKYSVCQKNQPSPYPYTVFCHPWNDPMYVRVDRGGSARVCGDAQQTGYIFQKKRYKIKKTACFFRKA